MDFSVTVLHNVFKFGMCIPKIHMEGSVSQNFDIGPSFNFMKCRNLHLKEWVKRYLICDIKSKPRPKREI